MRAYAYPGAAGESGRDREGIGGRSAGDSDNRGKLIGDLRSRQELLLSDFWTKMLAALSSLLSTVMSDGQVLIADDRYVIAIRPRAVPDATSNTKDNNSSAAVDGDRARVL